MVAYSLRCEYSITLHYGTCLAVSLSIISVRISLLPAAFLLVLLLFYLMVHCNSVVQLANISLHMNLLDLECRRHATNRLSLRLECLPWHLLICKTAEEQSSRLRSLLSLLSGSKKTEVCVPVATLESIVVDLSVGSEKAHGICVTQAGVVCGELAVNLTEQLAWLQAEDKVSGAMPARSKSLESQQSASSHSSLEAPTPLDFLAEEVHRAAQKSDFVVSEEKASVAASVDGAVGRQTVSAAVEESQPADGSSLDGKAPAVTKRGFRLPDNMTFQLPSLKVSCVHDSLDHVLQSGFSGLVVEAKGTQADRQAGSSALLDVQCQCGAFEVCFCILLLRGIP